MSSSANGTNNNIFLSDYMISIQQIKQIFDNSLDGLFVIDNNSKVIFANNAAALKLGKPVKEIIGLYIKDLLDMGLYDRSSAMESLKTKSEVTMLVKTITGKNSLSTSSPIIENNEVKMIITHIRSENTIDLYIKELEKERESSLRYKSAANYLNEINNKNKLIVAKSKIMKKIIFNAENIAKTDCTVLILGESGTGKEVLSRYIHLNSNRAKEPFIPVNCAAIPEELIESEFFGYEKGAFTGASNYGKPGFFEIANKGTLFLDEIGDMSLSMQSKLLRVIETGEIQRLGGTSSIKTNVRIISATNKNLYELIENGRFREDLYYRISVMPFNLPSLRERHEDIKELSLHFLNEFNIKYNNNKFFSDKLLEQFLSYDWPGNIRELKNVIERAFIISVDDELTLQEDLIKQPFNQKSNQFNHIASFKKQFEDNEDLRSLLSKVEKEYILKTLRDNGGRMGETAEKLGIHRTMLYKKLKQYEIG